MEYSINISNQICLLRTLMRGLWYIKSGNIEILTYDKADEVLKNFLNRFFVDIKSA